MDRSTSASEGDPGRERRSGAAQAGGFIAGLLVGTIVSVAAAALLILTSPPPTDLPRSGQVEIVGAPAAQGDPAPAVVVLEQGGATPAADEPPAAADTPAGSEAEIEPVLDGVRVIVEPATTEPATTGPGAIGPAPAAGSGPEAPPEPSVVASPQEPDEGLDGPPDAASAQEDPDPAAAEQPDSGQPAPDTPAEPSDGGASAAPTTGALAANASAFEAPERAPLLSVVLIGRGADDLSAERLELMTMPLTVALPPEDPRAAELAAAARGAGHEVLADVSPGADAAEQVAALDMAVGATATAGGGEADALTPMLAQLGRQGFAWVEPGIGAAAERIARETDLAYTQANRVVAGDASPEQIYRAIDAAAHRARQWGTSVLFLDASEPALEALVRWGLEQQGDSPVWFAPISAVIQRRGAF